jgi:hypothetical protein
MTPLCFIDTETTGLHPDRRAWEIAVIRRDDSGERETLLQILDVDLSNAEPKGLQVGGFYERHQQYAPRSAWSDGAAEMVTEYQAARIVERLTRGAHLVGAVPDFDARTLDPMLRRHGRIPAWHYHLVDVEAMAVGWLSAWASQPRRWLLGAQESYTETMELAPSSIIQLPDTEVRFGGFDPAVLTPPWRSDDLSRACGVEPPSEEDRHTALGDARWVMRLYDALTGCAP